MFSHFLPEIPGSLCVSTEHLLICLIVLRAFVKIPMQCPRSKWLPVSVAIWRMFPICFSILLICSVHCLNKMNRIGLASFAIIMISALHSGRFITVFRIFYRSLIVIIKLLVHTILTSLSALIHLC